VPLPIEPRLYQKYTGKMPGEAMSRMGESLAQSAAEKSNEAMRGPESLFATIRKWRMIASLVGSAIAALAMLYSFS
jgi:hypothetical protein